MWIVEMQSRFLKHPEYLHITIHGVNPGMVLSSIWNTANNKDRPMTKFLLQHCGITSRQGSFAVTHAATSPELGPDPKKQNVGSPQGRGGGKYINRVWVAPAKSYCDDAEARLRVWSKLDEELHLTQKGLLNVLGP
ncbi:hypothetical protein N7488_002834 [Penicillium malachiteum]|nr:hypothetical protein N7488_002834 [Penicillium malachiteum]